MLSLFINGSQLGALSLHNLWESSRIYPQANFGAGRLGTTVGFVRSLCGFVAQLYAPYFSSFNSSGSMFMHIIHTPNNNYNKGY